MERADRLLEHVEDRARSFGDLLKQRTDESERPWQYGRAYGQLALLCKFLNLPDDAIRTWQTAMPLLEETVASQPEDLSRGEQYAIWFLECYHALLEQGDFAEADQSFQRAKDALWNSPVGLNRVAWSLACPPQPEYQGLSDSIELAQRAIELGPDEKRFWNAQTFWNTLGYAQYCSKDYEAAVESLTRAVEMPYGDVVHNYLFLAMAYGQLGDVEHGLLFYRQAVAWTEKNNPADAWLADRFREAADSLGIDLRPFTGAFETEVDKISIVSEGDLTEAIHRSRKN